MTQSSSTDIFTVKQLTERLHITSRTLRYWEEEGLLADVRRTSTNRRYYSQNDVARLNKILEMKHSGYTLDQIKARLKTIDDLMPTQLQTRSSIRLVVDSTASLSTEVQIANEIDVLPLYISVGDHLYRDGIDINTTKFYAAFNANATQSITTSPITIDDFNRYYMASIATGTTCILVLTLSAMLSETYTNAIKAAKDIRHARIEVIDTQSSGLAIGLIIVELAKRLKAGASFDELIVDATRFVNAGWQIFSVKSLESLIRLGRIFQMPTQHFILKTMLDFRPVFVIQSGIFDVIDRVNTLDLAMILIKSELDQFIRDHTSTLLAIGISHSLLEKETLDLQSYLKAQYPLAEIIISEGSLILTCHLGPQTIAVAPLFSL